MTEDALRPTFRDPAGSLSLQEHHAVRDIHPGAREPVLEFLASPLYRRLLRRGDAVVTVIQDDPGGLRLLHPRIHTSTYPWEWTPSQWLAAATLTLRLCEEAIDEGWILKDATPLNILFLGAKPILVDVLSFERRQPGSSLWLAYAQYVRTFLLPLIANHVLGWPLALTLFRRDGYEPEELFARMNWPQRLSGAAFWPITLPTWLGQRRKAAAAAKTIQAAAQPAAAQPAAQPADDQLALHILKRMLANLARRTQRAVAARPDSAWSEYQRTLTHYSSDESAHKRAWLRQVFEQTQPRRVLDVGANTGEYSFLAAEMGIDVIALERDPAAAEQLFRVAQASQLPVLTILADLARPTPAAGWENGESLALLPRLERQCDLVMMLAVIHHLLLLEQIPLPAILALCLRLTRSFLVIEWVPVEDPMFQSLLRGRDDLYGGLTEADLLSACAGRFTVLKREPLANGRVLFLFQRVERLQQTERQDAPC